MFEIFCKERDYSGAIVVFYEPNEKKSDRFDLNLMFCNCTDSRLNRKLWPEDVIAQMILQGYLVSDGKDMYVEWKDAK